MADLSIELCGVELANPFIVSSGPLCYGAAGIKRCFAAGAAACVTKTISRQAAVNPTPHMVSLGKGALLNTEKWADLSGEQWIDVELPQLRDAGGVVIASMGHTVQEVEALARPVAATGVSLIEVVSYRAEDMAPMVAAAKRLSGLPVLAKIGPTWPDLMSIVDACVAAGADGISAADSWGPALHIDIEQARPALGGYLGYAWLSGSAILSLTLRIVADICRRHRRLPVVATGGVTDAKDTVEMMMGGAAAIGVHTAPLLQGLPWLNKVNQGLAHWLDKHGHDSPAAIRGLALPALQETEDSTPLNFRYEREKCTDCMRCVTVCAYSARALADGVMRLDRSACRSCGLCSSICPTAALTTV